MAKLKVRSYVAVRPPQDRTGLSVGFTQNIQRTNRIGASLTHIGEQLSTFNTLLEFQTEYLSDKGKEHTDVIKKKSKTELENRRELRRLERKDEGRATDDAAEDRVEAEPTVEDQKGTEEVVKKEKSGRLKGFLRIFRGIGNLLMPLLSSLGLMAALDWLAKNPDKVQNVVNFVVGWAKFGFNVLQFGMTNLADGITRVFGGDPNKSTGERIFDGLFGVGQMFVGLAGLWAASRIFFPWKLVKDFRRLSMLFDIFNQDPNQGQDGDQPRRRTNRQNRQRQRGRTRNASKAARQRYARRFGGDAAKRRFQGRVGGRGGLARLQKRAGPLMKKLGGGLKKLGQSKGLTKLTRIAGGAMSIMSGMGAYQDALAAGKSNSQAIGKGVGVAAGGIAGAAIATALLGPFIGPLAPILGSMIGEWAGGWLGEQLGPIVENAFGKISEWFTNTREFLKEKILAGIDIQLNGIAPFLDFFMGFIDFIQPAVDWLKGFNDFVFNSNIDLIIKGIRAVLGGAEFIANKAGQAWNWLTSPFREEGGPVERAGGGAVRKENQRKKHEILPTVMKKQAMDPARDWKKFASGGEFKNGQLPAEALADIGNGHRLAKSIAPQFKAMMAAAAADGYKMGTAFRINSSYRTYQRQQELYNQLGPGTAAYPGTSNHGLGRAVDLWYTNGAYKWLRQNAGKFGFTQIPGYETDNPDGHEAWHWENLTGAGTTKKIATSGAQVSTAPNRKVGQQATLKGKPVVWDGSKWVPETASKETMAGKTFAPEARNMGQGDSYFQGLNNAVSGIQYSDGAALNKTGNVSALSAASIGGQIDRQMQGSTAIVMLQQVNSRGKTQSTQALIVSRPNPSPMINRC